MSVPSIAPVEFRSRQLATKAAAAARGLDGLLIWSTGGSALDGYADVFWLTNHYSQVPRVNIEIPGIMRGWGQTAFILPSSASEGILVVESNDWRRDLVVADHVVHSHDLYQQVVAAMREAGLAEGRLGLIGSAIMPANAWHLISEALPRAHFEPADDILLSQRMRKSQAEIEMMRHASVVGAALQNAMFQAVEVGRTDDDLVREAFDVCCDLGAVPWEFAFASGPQSGHGYWGRLPAWDRQRKYVAGDIVHPDAYGCVNGYFYDVQRTYIVGGKPDKRLMRLLDGVVGVVEALCAACRPGTPVAEVARVRDTWLADHDLGQPKVPPSDDKLLTPLAASGHGVGTGFELPWIYEGSTDVLEPGMTLALEVYVSEPGLGTVANEEVVLVTTGEPEVLTLSSPARHW